MTDGIRRFGKCIGGPVLIALTLAFAGVTAFAQSCPTSVNGSRLDQNTRSSTSYGFNRPVCKPDLFGGEECHMVCEYLFPAHMQTGIVLSHFRVFASWTSKPQPGTPHYSSYACTDISRFPRYGNSATKVVDVSLDYMATPAAQAFGRTAAQQLVTVLEPWAIPCPGAAVPVQTRANTSSGPCRDYSERLKALEVKSSEIDGLLRFLDGHEEKERVNRNRLAYYNSIIAALNTPNYAGAHKRDIDNWRSKAESHDLVLSKMGLPPGTELIDAFRRVRDITVARIEFLKQGPDRIRDATAEKALTAAEMAKIRLDMTRAECGGRFDPSSCNITGEWVFVSGQQRETWRFDPATAGSYTAKSGGAEGTAEVFYKEVILRWETGENSGSFKFKMDESCQSGFGTKRFSGSPQTFDFSALRKNALGPRVFTPNMPYTVVFEGKSYETIYERQANAGRPIDIFFFKILMQNGYQAEQNGQKLWGRFVRDPSADHPDQSNAIWWVAKWKLDGSRWIADDRKGVSVEVR